MSAREQQTADSGEKIAEIKVIPFPTEMIDPSPYQARKHFDESGLQEMGASIREHGIIQPLTVRVADPASGRLELVAGERRWRGAWLVGLEVVPVIVRELSDTAAEEIMLIENVQREDLTESEEAQVYDRMLKLKDEAGAALYTLEKVSARSGKPVSHITARLKLLLCPKELMDAVDAGEVKVTTAMLVGRIPDPKARLECAREVLTPTHQQVPLNYEQTKELIRSRFVVRLDKKDFDLDDAMLVPVKTDHAGQRVQGGACTDCPFRSGNLEGVETRESASAAGKAGGSTRGSDPNMCTLPRCHKLKLDAAWREKKEKAQQHDQKVLDGEAAEKAFAGHNGDLAFDADYVNPADAVNLYFGSTFVSKAWKDALKGASIKTVLARHPETRQVLHLYERAEAMAALELLVKAEQAHAKQAEKEREKSDEEQAKDDADKQARAKEREQAELDAIAVNESVREVIEAVSAKGMEPEFYSLIFQMALTHSGADGMYFLGHFLEIKLPNGSHSGRDYEEEIIRIVKERAETPNAWLAWTVAALIARQVKWNGIHSDDLEACLKLVGLKLADIKRRAQTLRAVEKKARGKKPAEAPAAKGSSTDPVGYSTDDQVELTRAADERAKEERSPLLELPLVNRVSYEKEGYLEALLEAKVEASKPNNHDVFNRCVHFSYEVKKHRMTIDLARDEDGRWASGYYYGGGRGPWKSYLNATRAEAVKSAAEELKTALQGTNKETSKGEKAAAVKMLEVVDYILDQIAMSAVDLGGGPSESEKLNGVQDSILCRPYRFGAREIEAASSCLAIGTTTITTLIGPKPKPADKENYNAWSKVRMKLLRAAGKWSKQHPAQGGREVPAKGKTTKK